MRAIQLGERQTKYLKRSPVRSRLSALFVIKTMYCLYSGFAIWKRVSIRASNIVIGEAHVAKAHCQRRAVACARRLIEEAHC